MDDSQEKINLNNEQYLNNNISKSDKFNLSKEENNLEVKNKTISQIKNFFKE